MVRVLLAGQNYLIFDSPCAYGVSPSLPSKHTRADSNIHMHTHTHKHTQYNKHNSIIYIRIKLHIYICFSLIFQYYIHIAIYYNFSDIHFIRRLLICISYMNTNIQNTASNMIFFNHPVKGIPASHNVETFLSQ